MPTGSFLVERYLPGISAEELTAAAVRAAAVSAEMTAAGTSVRYLGTTFVPEDEACFCQFEAASAEIVALANERARMPFARIVAALRVPVEV